ncbi:MAG: hypothetical protein M3P33_02740, partial [bacterium]|nr:hypothetical protein [bacterium]
VQVEQPQSPNEEFAVVQSGWGVSHVAKAAGLNPALESSWNTVAAWNGFSNYREFRLSIGQKVKIKPLAIPVPTAPVAPVIDHGAIERARVEAEKAAALLKEQERQKQMELEEKLKQENIKNALASETFNLYKITAEENVNLKTEVKNLNIRFDELNIKVDGLVKTIEVQKEMISLKDLQLLDKDKVIAGFNSQGSTLIVPKEVLQKAEQLATAKLSFKGKIFHIAKELRWNVLNGLWSVIGVLGGIAIAHVNGLDDQAFAFASVGGYVTPTIVKTISKGLITEGVVIVKSFIKDHNTVSNVSEGVLGNVIDTSNANIAI